MHQHRQHSVLQLDIQGTPQRWLTVNEAALHYATGDVAWTAGDGPLAELRGGINVASGRQSRLEIHPIIALKGASRINLFEVVPTVTKLGIALRDRMTCAYCGEVFPFKVLQAEHIVPESRGGPWSWSNITSSCRLSRATRASATELPKRRGCLFCSCPTFPAASRPSCCRAG